MTATSQDFTTYQGDSALPVFTVTDAGGTAIDISAAQEIDWNARRNLSSSVVVDKTKTGGSISFVTDGTDGKFRVSITPADTQAMSGRYIHEAVLTDGSGNVSTVSVGTLVVGRAPIATYSGDPSQSTTDAVRFYIQDTDMDSPMLADGEISYVLIDYPNPLLAAAQCCRALAARFSQKVSKRVGDLSINFSDKAKQYLALATELEEQGSMSSITPYAGGVSLSDMQNVSNNTDRPTPPFQEKQFDNPSGPNNIGDPAQYDPNWIPFP